MCLIWLTSSHVRAAEPGPVEWRDEWPRFRAAEVAVLAGLAVAAGLIVFAWEPQKRAHLRGGVLFDDAARGALRGQTHSAQSFGATLSDVLYLGGVAFPFVVDIGIAALAVHRNADVAFQMLLINLQSFALAGVISLSLEQGAGRARPYTEDCQPNGSVVDSAGRPLLHRCGTSGNFKSLYSGHSAATATAAGLTCVHHEHIPLYGGGTADRVPCLVMIGVSFGTGVGRMIADEHWASDVLLGWSVGALAGYVLPSLLHYGFGDSSESKREPALHSVPLLHADRRGAAFGWAGVF